MISHYANTTISSSKYQAKDVHCNNNIDEKKNIKITIYIITIVFNNIHLKST